MSAPAETPFVRLWLDHPKIGCGYRVLIIIRKGPKWVRLFNPYSGDGVSIARAEWERMRAEDFRPSFKRMKAAVKKAQTSGLTNSDDDVKTALALIREAERGIKHAETPTIETKEEADTMPAKKPKKAKAAKAPKAAKQPKKTNSVPPEARAKMGKRAAIEAAAHEGKLPDPPDFSAETHARYRDKLAELIKLAKAGDVKALKAVEINPISTSPKALDRYRNLAVIAIAAKAKDAKEAA